MSYFVSNFSSDLIKQLHRLEDTDEVCRKMLSESIPILTESLKDTIKASHVDTGELWKSIEAYEPRKSKAGHWSVSASPTGRTKKKKKSSKVYARSKSGTKTSGVALYNDDKLWWLEYGTSKQSPSPVIRQATNNAESAVINKMQETFNEVVEGK